jgi:hypothetical protein
VSAKEQWHPPTYSNEDIIAIQSIAMYASGMTDNPPSQGQCQRALDWIINSAASTYDEPFRPDSQDTIAYMLGRRSVGLAIIKLMKLKQGLLTKHDRL